MHCGKNIFGSPKTPILGEHLEITQTVEIYIYIYILKSTSKFQEKKAFTDLNEVQESLSLLKIELKVCATGKLILFHNQLLFYPIVLSILSTEDRMIRIQGFLQSWAERIAQWPCLYFTTLLIEILIRKVSYRIVQAADLAKNTEEVQLSLIL